MNDKPSAEVIEVVTELDACWKTLSKFQKKRIVQTVEDIIRKPYDEDLTNETVALIEHVAELDNIMAMHMYQFISMHLIQGLEL